MGNVITKCVCVKNDGKTIFHTSLTVPIVVKMEKMK